MAKFKTNEGYDSFSPLTLSSSNGSQITISGTLKLASSGRILSDAEVVVSSSNGSKFVMSGNIIIPLGGGTSAGGYGIGIGTNSPFDAVHLVNGNFRVEGNQEQALIFKRSDLTNGPQWSWGRIVYGGDGSPEFRIIYQDDVTAERSVFEFDNKGIFASVRQSSGSHWEGFIETQVEPFFRLNSFPSMSLEFGRGNLNWTDVIMRRRDQGRLAIISQLSGGTEVTGNLDIANIYSSWGHLHLSSTSGVVHISGNMRLDGQMYNASVPTLTTLSKSVTVNFNNGHSFIINTSGSVTDITATLSNMKAGNSYIGKIVQGDAAYRNVVFTPTPKYSSGSAPTFSSGSGKEDIVAIWYDGTNSYLTFNPWFF